MFVRLLGFSYRFSVNEVAPLPKILGSPFEKPLGVILEGGVQLHLLNFGKRQSASTMNWDAIMNSKFYLKINHTSRHFDVSLNPKSRTNIDDYMKLFWTCQTFLTKGLRGARQVDWSNHLRASRFKTGIQNGRASGGRCCVRTGVGGFWILYSNFPYLYCIVVIHKVDFPKIIVQRVLDFTYLPCSISVYYLLHD